MSMYITAHQVQRFKKEATVGLERAKETGITVGTAAAFSLAAGKLGAVKGIPVDLAAGVLLHAAGFWGPVKGRKGQRIHDGFHTAGDGALASYFARVAYTVGKEWKETGHFVPASGLLSRVGDDSSSSGMSGALADQELARMVAAGSGR